MRRFTRDPIRAAKASATLAPAEIPQTATELRDCDPSSSSSVSGDVADITIRTRLTGQTRHIRRDDKIRTLKALDLPRPKPVTDADTVQENKRRICRRPKV